MNGNAVTNKIFTKPNINFNTEICSVIDINIKKAIPVRPSGTKTKPINKNIGDSDFNRGNLVILSVSAKGCFFPHFGHTLSFSVNFFPHEIHCILITSFYMYIIAKK